MRTAILSFLLAVTVLPAAAQEAKTPGDTIVVNAPGKVLLTRAKNGAINVAVVGKENNERYRLIYNTTVEEKDTTEWNLNLPFLKGKQKSGWKPYIGGLYYGRTINNGEPAGSELKGGWEVGITSVIGAKYLFGNSGTSFSTGLGYAAKIENGKKTDLRFNRVDGELTLEPLPEGASDGRLRLWNCQLNVPLQLTQRFGKNFGVSAGLLLHYNFYARAENKYKLDGREFTERMEQLKQRPMSFEYMGSVGWKDCSLFVKYNPNGIFRDGFGPQYETFSIGLKFFNF